MKITEINFIKELKRKNEDALEFVVKKYGRLFKSVINRILYEYPEDAEECLYDALIKIWENIDGYRHDVSFRSWAVVVAKHTALNKLKQLKRLEPAADIDLFPIADESGLTGDALFDEVFAELISCLNAEDKFLFTRIFWYGESIEEASEALGVAKSVTYNRISRGRKKIMKNNPTLFKGGNEK